MRERIRNQLIPDTKVEMTFERRRPPLELTEAARALARHAQRVYAEIGHKLVSATSPKAAAPNAAIRGAQRPRRR